MNAESSLAMFTNISAVRARLARPILALPLELASADEVVLSTNDLITVRREPVLIHIVNRHLCPAATRVPSATAGA